MARGGSLLAAAIIFVYPVLVESSQAQAGYGWTVGRTVVASSTPTTDDWLFVLEILSRGADRASVAAADATVCVKGEGGVVRAIHQLYQAPTIGEAARERLLRPLFGLQRIGAVRELCRIMMNPIYPPDHPISLAGGARALAVLGPEGARLIVDKLAQWGELPAEGDMDDWAGLELASMLAENPDSQNVEQMVRILEGSEVNSGGRLGAACALLGLGGVLPPDKIALLISNETNPVIKECLVKVGEGHGQEAIQDEPQGL